MRKRSDSIRRIGTPWQLKFSRVEQNFKGIGAFHKNAIMGFTYMYASIAGLQGYSR
jgi:hypothetical protein